MHKTSQKRSGCEPGRQGRHHCGLELVTLPQHRDRLTWRKQEAFQREGEEGEKHLGRQNLCWRVGTCLQGKRLGWKPVLCAGCEWVMDATEKHAQQSGDYEGRRVLIRSEMGVIYWENNTWAKTGKRKGSERGWHSERSTEAVGRKSSKVQDETVKYRGVPAVE